MILTNRFDPDVRVYKEAKYLITKGFDVEILCWDRENEYKDRVTEYIDGIKIKRFFPYSEYGTGLKQIHPYIKFIQECKNYLNGKEYDYIHCHDLDGIIAGYLARKNKSSFIFDMHEFYEVNGKNQKLRYIVRGIVNFFQNRSSNIIYVNEVQTNVMSDINKKKLILLPNYPDRANYEGCEKSTANILRISYIGAVRQYNELKNLMDACNGIDNIKIAIHGVGVAYKRLKDIENNYDNVNVTGKYDYTESAALYGNTDVLYALYPLDNLQNKTAYPIKLFEAIITKTPIIVNEGTALEEYVIKNGIGFAVDGSNIQDIRKLIKYINGNRHSLDEKIKNLEKIQYNYSWEEVVNNLDKIYK